MVPISESISWMGAIKLDRKIGEKDTDNPLFRHTQATQSINTALVLAVALSTPMVHHHDTLGAAARDSLRRAADGEGCLGRGVR
jgi:hypothetical protein